MKWIEVIIKTKKEAEDAIYNLLEGMGAKGVSIEDGIIESSLSWDYIDEELLKRDYTLIKAYFPENININEILFHIKEGLTLISHYLDTGKGEIEIRFLDEEDWAKAWKKYYKPVEIGNIVIVPSWEEYKEKNKVVVKINPGMAFGTGTHETTILCIMALQEFLKKGMEVIDVGTGSGILAITAKKLGARRVLALDIDDIAIEVAKKNAILNNENIEIIKRDLIEGIEDKFDLILANIVSDTIIRLTRDIKRIMKENTIFISSGIIESRLKDVVDTLKENDLRILDIREKNSWFLIVSKLGSKI
ncbi:MAG: 50S ribosomal protein L11 methyltransferase [Dictyoglomus sp.]|nr:50S ribosomal protein L11 methyltransferase [Dictyoglomus sp.]MDW8188321.1 50S ribosomal protein L11 methyltransferase [Dictyoglomus sp.]